MAWVKVESGARDHPKIIKLSRDCNITVAHALGTVTSLWLWTIEHTPDGDLSGYDADDIEIAAGWTGERGQWYAAAVARKLLDVEGNVTQVHDWQEYTTSYRNSQRTRAWRARKRLSSDTATSPCAHSDVTVTSPCANVAPERRGEEKRGEDLKRITTTTTPAHAREISGTGGNGKAGTGFAKDCRKIIKAWNKAVPQSQQVPPEGTPAIDRSYSELACSAPPITSTEIIAAVGNYRQALELPQSQAHPHSLGRFLAREIVEKFTPGNFNIANYDKSRFAGKSDGDGEFNAEEEVRRLKAKGMI